MSYTNYPMMPPVGGAETVIAGKGRSYKAANGAVTAVPDFDTAYLSGHGWDVIADIPCGPTASRPTPGGGLYLDISLGKVISFFRGAWVDPATGSAA